MQVMCKMHIVHIDESAAWSEQQRAALAAHAQRLLHFVCQHCPAMHADCISLQALYDADVLTTDANSQLQRLLDVRDATQREHLLELLRMELLVQKAAQLGCNKIVRGDSSTLLAGRFIAAAAQVRWALSSCCPVAAALVCIVARVVLHFAA